LALHNLAGALVSLLLFAATSNSGDYIPSNIPLLVYGAIALTGSIILAMSYRYPNIGKNNIANFIRLPAGITIGVFLFGDNVTLQTAVLSLILIYTVIKVS